MKTKPQSDALDALVREAERVHDAPPTALMRAVHAGDAEAVRSLLADGAEVDARTPPVPGSLFFEGGRTALMMATATGDLPIVQLLLDAGASPVAVADDGETPLTCATRSAEVVALLLDRGAPPDPVGAKFTPLYQGAARGRLAVCELLLGRGARVDHPIWTGATPLLAAARGGWVAVVERLLSDGAQVDHQDRSGRTATMEAIGADAIADADALARTLEVLRALLAKSPDLGLRDRDGDTALATVAAHGRDLFEVAALRRVPGLSGELRADRVLSASRTWSRGFVGSGSPDHRAEAAASRAAPAAAGGRPVKRRVRPWNGDGARPTAYGQYGASAQQSP